MDKPIITNEIDSNLYHRDIDDVAAQLREEMERDESNAELAEQFGI